MTTRDLRNWKKNPIRPQISALTCYDFQTAQLLNETNLDIILVGDSLGNVILGYDHTISVELGEMEIFGKAVRRGAPDKFLIMDMPFGTYATFNQGVENCLRLFQTCRAEAVKLEGAFPHVLEIISRITDSGVPVMGHIGLIPQSVHALGGHYQHGKNEASRERLLREAQSLEKAGVFAIVLECIEKNVAAEITALVTVPTIGIGAGQSVDGQILVINDLLKMGPNRPPKFCQPVADFYSLKKEAITQYLETLNLPPTPTIHNEICHLHS
ncbi:MAG: 3-methyl-2-oxobutanoate hydroxymethyltransferase [Bdellovibrio sp.]|nr:3-methyl-2-oxobutanoate hydroxymethyltransferase [Bdellovibrio sp.]